ncbi:fimbrial protein [Stenotrophomonas maltophilia]|nr:fimbrial protein [Stenotrophomonas maltophilia]
MYCLLLPINTSVIAINYGNRMSTKGWPVHSGRRLVLELVDVHDPASTSNTLKAAPGSTANGVAVQILSGGNPVRMKAPWTHGAASGSTLPVPFSARYLRTTGTLRTGSIRGEATLLADYY